MKITIRMWIMILFVVLSLVSIFSIPPTFLKQGVVISSIEINSSAHEIGLSKGISITSINGLSIDNIEDYALAINTFKQSFGNEELKKVILETNKGEIIGLLPRDFSDSLTIEDQPKTRIVTGLDLQGGVRALVVAENISLSTEQLDDLIAVTQERLNVYGLSDVVIRPKTDTYGNNFMSVEIAGSSPADLENLIAQQGKFEAKIGDELVFMGGDQDITYVGVSGQDAGIYSCNQGSDAYYCEFRFAISLSEKAAQRQANITSNLSANLSSGGRYLEKPLNLYVDDSLLDSLQISVDLKGRETTQIQISGSGAGSSEQEAYEAAKVNMKKLQTILKTGSLPYKLKIEKIDKISPTLGKEFTKTILLAGLVAAAGVFVIIYIKYRRLKISAIVILTMASEILIVLGAAALIKWNLDLAGIAGIIASIGTGVDDQIVVLDESSRSKELSMKQRIKIALAIIFTAYATTAVSLLPLMSAGAGLLAGFAITTLIGITAGVFITRPAFADIIEQIKGD